jgi:hypothetical protein
LSWTGGARTARVSTDSNGSAVRSFGHYPFGETWYETGTVSKWKFTSYEPESLNDYAVARIYLNRLARSGCSTLSLMFTVTNLRLQFTNGAIS